MRLQRHRGQHPDNHILLPLWAAAVRDKRAAHMLKRSAVTTTSYGARACDVLLCGSKHTKAVGSAPAARSSCASAAVSAVSPVLLLLCVAAVREKRAPHPLKPRLKMW